MLRTVRDMPAVNAMLRAPVLGLRRLGFRPSHSLYQHLIYRGAFQVHCGAGRVFTMISHGHALENNLYWEGVLGHEPETVQAWLRLAPRARVVLDIGANTGFFALAAACVSPGADVHAFEPVSRIASLLQQNCAANPDLRITVHECAVGAEDGTAALYDPGGDNCYSATLNPAFLAEPQRGTVRRQYVVPVLTIDTLVERLRMASVDLIKLDIEGYEEVALTGMETTLARCRPTLVMEVVTPPRRALVRWIERLRVADYDLYRLTPDGPVKDGGMANGRAYENVLLLPREKALSSAA